MLDPLAIKQFHLTIRTKLMLNSIIITILATVTIFKTLAGYLVANPEKRFSRDMAKILCLLRIASCKRHEDHSQSIHTLYNSHSSGQEKTTISTPPEKDQAISSDKIILTQTKFHYHIKKIIWGTINPLIIAILNI